MKTSSLPIYLHLSYYILKSALYQRKEEPGHNWHHVRIAIQSDFLGTPCERPNT